MRLSSRLWRIFLILLYPSTLATIVLYFYPAFFSCDFPAATKRGEAAPPIDIYAPTQITAQSSVAPFRLLVLADPQLEGDSSLPDPDLPTFPALKRLWTGNFSDPIPLAIATAAKDFVVEDIPLVFSSYRKRLDILGNDYYLAHIYRSVFHWTSPTHVTVLGDLIGSQWVSDGEFDWRGWRYWNRVFKGGRRVEDEITRNTTHTETLGQDKAWYDRIINIAGNHDIGYAGDIDEARVDRFRRVFGQENWAMTFELPPKARTEPSTSPFETPKLRLVILNSMNLDGPALSSDLQDSTYKFINHDVISSPHSPEVGNPYTTTLLLTHIPLHKPTGLCVDSPFFDYYDGSSLYNGNQGVREQNHLSPGSTKAILESIYGMSDHPSAPANGMGRGGLIMSGHDHAGCDVYHYLTPNNTSSPPADDVNPWKAARWDEAEETLAASPRSNPGIREITVRSMMGSYGGNAGLLSAWFDEEDEEWRFEYATCSLGVQHFWWGVHVVDLVTVGALVLSVLCAVWEDSTRVKVAGVKKRQ